MQPRIAWRVAVDAGVILALIAGGVSYGSKSRDIQNRLSSLEREVHRMRTERGSVPISVEAATRLTALEGRQMDLERRLERLEGQ